MTCFLRLCRVFPAVAAAAAISVAAQAAEPTAMVEDITAERDDLQLMDYLEPGRTVELAPDETMVLGYLLSCVQETITGGTVTVGQDQSTVAGGRIDRQWVDCDGGSVVLAKGQDQEAGATAFRSDEGCVTLPPPDRIVYDTSPVIRFQDDPAPITITRLCAPPGEAAISVPANSRIVDLRRIGIALSVGETYRFEAPTRTVVVKVSGLAAPDQKALISRLLPM